MEWKRGPILGRGSSAAVSLATTAAGDLFAVKSADISSSTLLQNEECLISQLSSPFIVKCFGSDVTCEEDNKHVYNLFLEYVPGGTLSDLIRNHGGSLPEEAIQFYTRQMLEGLNYLHLNGIAHCDIKGQNILITNDGVKIADFGCAKWAECGGGSAAATKIAGTPAYMAPEAARGEEQSFPADIWALGCTIIEMATGSNPWPEMKDPASAVYRIAYSDDLPEVPNWFSDTAKDFVAKCLMRDPKERWTAAELLMHPFFDDVAKKGDFNDTKKSPTSVMDQGFWDAVEVSDSSPTDFASSPENSPAGRIVDLIGEGVFCNLSFPEWTDEQDWVTVRGDRLEECSIVRQPIEETDQDYESLIDEITSIAIEDSLFNFISDEISVIDIVSSYEVMMLCESWNDDDSVSTTVSLQRMVMNLFSDSAQIFLHFIFTVFFLCFFHGIVLHCFFNCEHLKTKKVQQRQG